MFNRVLLAIDDSPSGPAAVSFTIALAASCQACVHVVHVDEFATGGRGHGPDTMPMGAGVMEEAVTELLAAGIEATGVMMTASSRQVARRIAEMAVACSCDVIVVGSRRRHRFLGASTGKGVRERLAELVVLPLATAPPPLRVGRRPWRRSSEHRRLPDRHPSSAIS